MRAKRISPVRWLFRRTSPLVVLATLAVSLYLYVTQWSMIAMVGGFTLHVTDLLVGLTAVYCIAGILLARCRHSPLELTLLILCGLLVMSFWRGIAESSAAAAGVEFREFAGFVSLVGFIFVWGRQLNVDWIFGKIVVLGWGIVLLSLARLVLGLDAFILEELDAWYELRTLNGAAALMLGQASLTALNRALSAPRGRERWRTGATFLVFGATLLISQQRTATLATLAGLSVIIAFLPRHCRTIIIGIGSVAVLSGAVIIWTAWIGSGGDMTEYVPRALSMILLEEGTFGWRVNQWERYFDFYLHAPLIDQIIGQPFGALRLVVPDSQVLTSAHNEYVQLLLNVGAAGVMLFASVLICALVRGLMLLKTANRFNPSSKLRLAVAIVAAHAVFSVGYLLPNEQGLLLATALQIIATAPKFSKNTALDWSQGRGRRSGTHAHAAFVRCACI